MIIRDLTEEERRLAPDCCDKYFINDVNRAVYVNSKDMNIYPYGFNSPVRLGDAFYGYSVMVNIKPFDIAKHEWSDLAITKSEPSCDALFISACDFEEVMFCKDDSIAIAKHFGLTAEDLK